MAERDAFGLPAGMPTPAWTRIAPQVRNEISGRCACGTWVEPREGRIAGPSGRTLLLCSPCAARIAEQVSEEHALLRVAVGFDQPAVAA